MRFTERSTLAFETYARFGEVAIKVVEPSEEDGTPTVQLGPITELPRTLTVNLANGPIRSPVLGWSCK
jgi:hypothetical protein